MAKIDRTVDRDAWLLGETAAPSLSFKRSDINARMGAWKQATASPERVSEFLKAYPLSEFNNRTDIARDRADRVAHSKKDLTYGQGGWPNFRELPLEEYFNLVVESGAKSPEEFADFLTKRFADEDPQTAIEAYRDMKEAQAQDEKGDIYTSLEYSAPRGGDFRYTGLGMSDYDSTGKKYLLMNKPGARTQRRKFATDPLDLAKRGAKAAVKDGSSEAKDTLKRIDEAKSSDEPIDKEERREHKRDAEYPKKRPLKRSGTEEFLKAGGAALRDVNELAGVRIMGSGMAYANPDNASRADIPDNMRGDKGHRSANNMGIDEVYFVPQTYTSAGSNPNQLPFKSTAFDAMADAAAEEGPDDFEAPGIKHMKDTKKERNKAIQPVVQWRNKADGAYQAGYNTDIAPNKITPMDVNVDTASYLEDLMSRGLITREQYDEARKAFNAGRSQTLMERNNPLLYYGPGEY